MYNNDLQGIHSITTSISQGLTSASGPSNSMPSKKCLTGFIKPSNLPFDLEDCKREVDLINEYKARLRKLLGLNWIEELGKVLSMDPLSIKGLSKPRKTDCYEIALEYCLLTEGAKIPHEKDIIAKQKRSIEKLLEYFEFYGYTVTEESKTDFEKLMIELLSSAKKVSADIAGYKKFLSTSSLEKKKAKFNNLKREFKKTRKLNINKQKYSIPEEHKLESPSTNSVTSGDVSKKENITKVKCTTRIINRLKRLENKSLVETKDSKAGLVDIGECSEEVINMFFTYLDLKSTMNSEVEKYLISGNFVVAKAELKLKEINEIYKAMDLQRRDNYDSIRTIRPHKKFYGVLIQTILKFGIPYLWTVTNDDFNKAIRYQLKAKWKPEMQEPIRFFLEASKRVAANYNRKEQGIEEFFKSLQENLVMTRDNVKTMDI